MVPVNQAHESKKFAFSTEISSFQITPDQQKLLKQMLVQSSQQIKEKKMFIPEDGFEALNRVKMMGYQRDDYQLMGKHAPHPFSNSFYYDECKDEAKQQQMHRNNALFNSYSQPQYRGQADKGEPQVYQAVHGPGHLQPTGAPFNELKPSQGQMQLL